MTRIEALSESQVADLHRFYRNEWWSKDRTLDDTRRMLAATGIFVAFADSSGRLAAFARVLTDSVFKAFIFDVIVDPAHRAALCGASARHVLLPGLDESDQRDRLPLA